MAIRSALALVCLLATTACDATNSEASGQPEPTADSATVEVDSAGAPGISGKCRRWLAEVIVRAGAPEQPKVERRQLLPSFGALKLLIPRYEGRFEVYVFAEEPDRVNVNPGLMQILDRVGEFTIRRALGERNSAVLCDRT
jgi:hypothetical protein